MKKIIKRILCVGVLCFTLLLSNGQTDLNGSIEYFYMTRLKDLSVVNIPFRALDLHVQHQNNNLDVNANVSLEYRTREDTDFLENSNLEDFSIDIRELYLSYYLDNGEIRLGKQIHSWGSVDENSPIDNLNSYDYYYLLLGGPEKKLGSHSIAFDYYVPNADLTYSLVYTPLHNTSRVPINDPDYPLGFSSGLSLSPETVVLNDNTPYELGLSTKYSFNFGDISLSTFSAYDRLPNLSGLTIYTDEFFLGNVFSAVPRWSYRYTNSYNIGSSLLFDDFTLRIDHTEFITEDRNDIDTFLSIEENPSDVCVGNDLDPFTCAPALYTNAVRSFEESAEYSQTAIQLEMPIPGDMQINMQYFNHNLNKYDANELNLTCDELVEALPAFSAESCADIENDLGTSLDQIETINYFMPGLGSPIAMIASESIILNFEKYLLDNNLLISLTTFQDLDRGNGNLTSLEIEYDFGSGLNVAAGITNIKGDDLIDDYTFNSMEDFSHFRMQVKYYF